MPTIFLLSAMIGALQVVDGILLLRAKGRVDKVTGTISMIEIAWFVALVLAVDFGVLSRIEVLVVASYLVYMTVGLSFSFLIQRKSRTPEVLPVSWVWAGLVFGFYFMAANLALYIAA